MSEKLTDRLRAEAEKYHESNDEAGRIFVDAADAIEELERESSENLRRHDLACERADRAERVVEAARQATDVMAANDAVSRNAWAEHASLSFNLMREALAAYDTTRADPTPKTYEFVKSLYEHECRYGCDSKWAVNCNCAGKCKKHDTARADTVRGG